MDVTFRKLILHSAASCSVPFVFTAGSLLAKDPKSGEAVPWNPLPQQWIDGSVDNDIPMTRLAEMFNVNHFIVSQVNPHVVPFLMKEEGILSNEAHNDAISAPLAPTWLGSLSALAKTEALYRMHTLTEFGIFPNLLTKTISVLSQKYSGDITILPEISYADFPRMLSNPTPEFMQQALLSGERATWPKISIIKNHCAIELALDDTVQKFRTRVVFEPGEIESRMHSHVKRNSLTGSHKTVKKRSKKARPISQNSAKEPLQGRPSSLHKEIRADSMTPAPRRVHPLPALGHKKSRTINTVLAQATGPARPFDNNPPSKCDGLVQPRSSQDITSSGAEETSNLNSRSSSSTSPNLSSPTESPSPPTPKHRFSPFRSNSQPNTPTGHPSPSSPSTPKASDHLSLAMTPASAVTAAESKYKRIFHSTKPSKSESKSSLLGKPRSSKTAIHTAPAGTNDSSSGNLHPSPGGMRRGWGLEIDIPGTAKGLVGRGKRKE